MTEEIYADIDIVDENNKVTGKATDFFDLHENNILHRAAQIWLIEGDNLIFQKRGKSVTMAGMLDATAGGHVDTGESPKVAAVREAFEEIGLTVSEGELGNEFVFRFKGELKQGWFENEFRHIYFVQREKFDLILNYEVEEFVKIPLVDVKKFFLDNDDKLFVPCNEPYYNFIFEVLEEKFSVKFNE
jgi:isopentenyl-diphosphate delta-isomerase